jgi:glyoxylate reductase
VGFGIIKKQNFMALNVLVTHRIPDEGLEILKSSCNVTLPEDKHFSTEELEQRIPDYDALIPVFGFKIGKELIYKGKKLKIIANFGVGYNNIDVKAATENNIIVTNTPKTVIEPTAELGFALLLSLTRRVTELDHKLKSREEVQWEVMANLGHTLENKTLGIIGMGNIGRSFALKAKAFGMNIIYHTRSPMNYTDEKTYHAAYTPLNELIEQSDVISLHTPLTDETHHLLDDEKLKKMKQGAFIINTARGAVIDEQALIKQLQNGHLGGAGLDVFEFEPQISEELLHMENVVLAPHVGTANYETRKAMAEEAAFNIKQYINGHQPPNIVNPK